MLQNGINSLFYNEDGTFKADAARRFVMASDDGNNLVSQLQKIAYRQAKTEATQEILTRGQRTAPEQGGRQAGQDDQEAQALEYFKQSIIGGINTPNNY
jgi:hypothetical protein